MKVTFTTEVELEPGPASDRKARSIRKAIQSAANTAVGLAPATRSKRVQTTRIR